MSRRRTLAEELAELANPAPTKGELPAGRQGRWAGGPAAAAACWRLAWLAGIRRTTWLAPLWLLPPAEFDPLAPRLCLKHRTSRDGPVLWPAAVPAELDPSTASSHHPNTVHVGVPPAELDPEADPFGAGPALLESDEELAAADLGGGR